MRRLLVLGPFALLLAACGGSDAPSTALPKPAYEKMVASIAQIEKSAESSTIAESSCISAGLGDPACSVPLLAAMDSASITEFGAAYSVSLPPSEGRCTDALHDLSEAVEGYWDAWTAFGDAVDAGQLIGTTSANVDDWRDINIPSARDAFVAACGPA